MHLNKITWIYGREEFVLNGFKTMVMVRILRLIAFRKLFHSCEGEISRNRGSETGQDVVKQGLVSVTMDTYPNPDKITYIFDNIKKIYIL